jgi:prefoldin subunit 5
MQGSVSEKIDYLEAELKKLKERVDAQEKTIKEHQKTIREIESFKRG